MALKRFNLRAVATAAIVFLVTAAVLAAVNRAGAPLPDDVPRAASSGVPRSTDGKILAFQAAIEARPRDAKAYALLGEAYLQKYRETADAGYYEKAEGILRQALERDGRNLNAIVGLGTLALGRHDFDAALKHGLDARRVAPDSVAPYAVLVDAQVELGRYEAAGRTLQRMIDLKPNLASYARVSYFRELHGDLDGAVEAMRLGVSSNAFASENLAYVQTLLGNLEFSRGRPGAAAVAYRTALTSVPSYAPAGAGLARLAAARGNHRAAIDRYRRLVDRLPLPEYAIALAETEIAAGRRGDARRTLALVGAIAGLLRAAGVNTDAELALFEADHGSPSEAVTLARRAFREAPSVRSADALGWALTRAGRPDRGLRYARRALALGSRDPLFLYHAGVSAKAAGRPVAARRYLERSLSPNPRFSPLHAPRARRALEGLR